MKQNNQFSIYRMKMEIELILIFWYSYIWENKAGKKLLLQNLILPWFWLKLQNIWQLMLVCTFWNNWPFGSWQSYNISLCILAWVLNSLPSGCKFSGYRSETWFPQYSCISIQLWVCKIIVLKATFHPVVMDAAQPNIGSNTPLVFVQSHFYLPILI